MPLTGFQSVKDKSVRGNLLTISNGTSPFVHGSEIQIVDYDFVNPIIDGEVDTEHSSPVFLVKMAGKTETVNYFLSMINRPKLDFDLKEILPNGDIDVQIRDIIRDNMGKSDSEILSAIVTKLKDAKIILKRKAYAGRSKDGRAYPTSLIEMHSKK